MNLLTTAKPTELPVDALLARLRYRRAIIDLADEEAVEAAYSETVSWVYRRLNCRLRKRLEPFLDLLAMRSLVVMLRYSLAGEATPLAAMRHSLLAEPLQRLATVSGDTEITVAKLETSLVRDYPFVRGLLDTYRNQGPGGAERKLTEGILQYGLARSSGVVKGVLSYLVDTRNCLTIHKLWRWKVRQPPSLIAGGQVTETQLLRIWSSHDSNRLSSLVYSLSRVPGSPDNPIAMEQCFLNGMTLRLKQAGRNPLGIGVIIEYLWRAQLSAHNQQLRQALESNREDLLGEVLLL